MLVKLAFLLPMVGCAMRLLRFAGTYRLLSRLGRPAPNRYGEGVDFLAVAQRLAWLVGIVSRNGPYRATCLRQSLLLWALLRRRGIPADLRIGVGKDSELLRAHAWLELGGEIVNDAPTVTNEFAAYASLGDRLRSG